MSLVELTSPLLQQRFQGHQARELPRSPQTRLAAVAAVVRFYSGLPEVMLIKRAVHPGDHWSGHMAFPGGRKDPEDADTLRTAIRETREEVAVDLDRDARFVGRLDDIQAIAKGRARDMLIVPYVFELERAVNPVLEETEVAMLTWAPLVPMMDGSVDTTLDYEHEGKVLTLPGYTVGDNVVWGLTHRMLQLLFRVIRQ